MKRLRNLRWPKTFTFTTKSSWLQRHKRGSVVDRPKTPKELRTSKDKRMTTRPRRFKRENGVDQLRMLMVARYTLRSSQKPAFLQTQETITEISMPTFSNSCFERLCKDLKETYKVGCVIHMDGAKYHTRRENPKPTKITRKPEILEWLTKNNIDLPPPKGRNHTVKEIMDHLETIDWPVVRACSRIAKEYGHRIKITPPYHCEVQPIERVWVLAKNPIALNPIVDKSALHLRDRLYHNFAKITQRQLISSWRDALYACKAHLLVGSVEDVDCDEDEDDFEEVPDDMDLEN